jgi:hypothetical protein
LINTEIEIYRSISREEEIRDVLLKIFKSNQRLVWIMFHLKTKLKTKISHYEKNINYIKLVLNSTYKDKSSLSQNLSSPTVKLKPVTFELKNGLSNGC